jgi:predicted metalloprotease
MGGPIVVSGGGGVLLLLLVVASMMLGVNPFEAGPVSAPEGGAIDSTDTVAQCQTGADAATRTDCRVVGYVDSVQKYWSDEFARRGLRYEPARTVLFSGYTQAGCGVASEEQGPFYCPVDARVYLDVTFFDDLRSRFGASGGPFAEGYVIAHEYGHHVQDLLGILSASGATGPSSASVSQELMADCLAGIWANHAASTGYLKPPTDREIADALDAAAAVGDDRIQRATQGRVQPERWTHGSAQQRQDAFRIGYRSGEMRDCGA